MRKFIDTLAACFVAITLILIISFMVYWKDAIKCVDNNGTWTEGRCLYDAK